MIKVEVKAELVPIESVTPYHANIKKHPQSQVDQLASMIAEYGWDQPIVVDGKGVIIKGHGRLEAAKKLGLTEIPVVKRTDLTPAQVKAARIADNKVAESEWDLDNLKLELAELGELDFDLSLTGFDEDLVWKNFDDDEANDTVKNTSKELGEDEFSDFDHTCPKCSFEWNDK